MKFTNYMEAPDFKPMPRPWLFLAGGITGCEDWQLKARDLLLTPGTDGGTLWNPRRKAFDLKNEDVAKEQIIWEYHMLSSADAILFWFCADQIQPITLFELGRWSTKGPFDKPLFIGAHPKYQRRLDVEVQMSLAQPGLPIFKTLEEVCAEVLKHHYTI